MERSPTKTNPYKSPGSLTSKHERHAPDGNQRLIKAGIFLFIATSLILSGLIIAMGFASLNPFGSW